MNYFRKKPRAARLDRGTEQRDFPRHRKWIRTFACVVPGCQELPIECAHWRGSLDGGVSLKPHDAFCLPLCRSHHARQHQIGEPAFEKETGLSMERAAREFAGKSPCPEIRAKLLERGVGR